VSAPETCPLCGTARPRGAPRCACNYVFEYGPAPRPRRPSGGIVPVLIAVALVAVVGGLLLSGTLRGRTADGADWRLALILLGGGLFCIVCSLLDVEWFIGSRKARLFVAIAGRSGARVIYSGLGGLLTGMGAGILYG
jgi:hypothetical protein